jgi:inosine-uridine nucleoside N-ribohydrolase
MTGEEHILLITDPGLDPDDVVAIMTLVGMQRRGSIRLLGVVANTAPAHLRARLAKGVLNALGLGDVPVAIGTNCNTTHDVKPYEFDFALADESELIQDGAPFMEEVLRDAATKSVTLLLISGLTDAHQLVMKYPDLVQEKVKQVIIMGGATFEHGQLVVDLTATNNRCDPNLSVALELHSLLLQLCIPLKICTRYAAYAAAVTPQFYDELARSGGSVGQYLQRIQQSVVEAFWQYACRQPATSRQNRFWFAQRFCKRPDLPCPPDESPWAYVCSLHLYDPIAALWLAYPDEFVPRSEQINGVPVSIVGLSDEEHGLVNPARIIRLIKELALT